jgi:CheY-like chemotaxis protein
MDIINRHEGNSNWPVRSSGGCFCGHYSDGYESVLPDTSGFATEWYRGRTVRQQPEGRDNHGKGPIKVYSEPSEGTVFKIFLPLCDEAALAKKLATPAPAKGGHETILVAEDDGALRELSRRILEASGYTVISAEDGEEAIAKFLENRERINLVLLDMIMPKKNGKEVSAAIRKVCPKMKILLASGYTMEIISNKELQEKD